MTDDHRYGRYGYRPGDLKTGPAGVRFETRQPDDVIDLRVADPGPPPSTGRPGPPWWAWAAAAVLAVSIAALGFMAGQASGATPPECITALDSAETVIGYGSDGMDSIAAVLRGEQSMATSTMLLNQIADDVETESRVYAPAAATCRGE